MAQFPDEVPISEESEAGEPGAAPSAASEEGPPQEYPLPGQPVESAQSEAGYRPGTEREVPYPPPTERGVEYRPGAESEMEPRRGRAFLQVPWSRRDVLWGAIVGFALLAAATVTMLVMLGVYLAITGAELRAAAGLVTLLAELVLLIPVWWFAVRKYCVSWSELGLRDFAYARGLGLGCLALLVALSFNALWSLFLSLLGVQGQLDMLRIFGGGLMGLLFALFTGGVVAPIAEEIFFRGFVFAGLYRHMGLRRAVVCSALLFALVHILPTSWPPIFVLGILFALLYEQTGSIWPAVLLHGAINSLSFLALYVLELVNRSVG